MTAVTLIGSSSSRDEQRLVDFGLSTDLLHTALRPGVERSKNRSSKALRSTRGTDIYHDSMEQLHQLLAEDGWSLVYVDQQPRLVHPDGLIALTISAARNVGVQGLHTTPRTGRKGKATRNSLPPRRDVMPMLFGQEEAEAEAASEHTAGVSAQTAPLWMLVHERTEHGLNLELCRPGSMSVSGIVTEWADRIPVAALNLNGDFSMFDDPEDEEINVSVEAF